jgi:hypothetical protein
MNLNRDKERMTLCNIGLRALPPMNADATNQIEPVLRSFDEFES